LVRVRRYIGKGTVTSGLTPHEPTHRDGGADPISGPIKVAGVPNLPASKITSERFPMARMPAGDSGVLTATGAGLDPEYRDILAFRNISRTTVVDQQSVTINIPTAYDMIMVLLRLERTNAVSATVVLFLRLNGYAGTNYDSCYADGSTVTLTTGTDSIRLGEIGTGTARKTVFGSILIQGRGAVYRRHVIVNTLGVDERGLWGTLNPNEDITSLTIGCTAGHIFSGYIEVWGRNLLT